MADEANVETWCNDLKVACRDLEQRKKHRKNPEVFKTLYKVLAKQAKLKGDLVPSLCTSAVAAFANLVVEDDEVIFTACFNAINYKILPEVVNVGKYLIEKENKTDEETNLLKVCAVSITNFSMQLTNKHTFILQMSKSETDEDKEIREREDEIVELVSDKAVSPVEFCMSLLSADVTDEVKKPAFDTLVKLNEFDAFHMQILFDPNFDVFIGKVDPNGLHFLKQVFSRIGQQKLGILNKLKNLKHLRNSVIELAFDSEAAAGLLAVSNFLLLPFAKQEQRDAVDISELCKKLVDRISSHVESDEDLVFLAKSTQEEIHNVDTSTEPLFGLLEALMHTGIKHESGFVHSFFVETQKTLLNLNLDVSLSKLAFLSTFAIEKELEETLAKKETDKDADINRDRVMCFAHLRKASFSLLARLASSDSNCNAMISKAETDSDFYVLLKTKKPITSIVQLAWSVVDGMSNFDVEGSQVALSFVRNCIFAESTRVQAMQMLRKSFPVGLRILEMKLMEHQDVNMATMSVAMCRLVLVGLVEDNSSADVVKEFLGDGFLDKLLLSVTEESRSHPVVKAEMSRLLSVLVASSQVDGWSHLLDSVSKEDKIRILEHFSTFLLQSEYACLAIEALAAIKVILSTDMDAAKVVLDKQLYFEENSPEAFFAKLNRRQKGVGNEIKGLFNAIDKLDINLTEEDVMVPEPSGTDSVHAAVEAHNKKILQREREKEARAEAEAEQEEAPQMPFNIPSDEKKLVTITMTERLKQLELVVVPIQWTTSTHKKEEAQLLELTSSVLEMLGEKDGEEE